MTTILTWYAAGFVCCTVGAIVIAERASAASKPTRAVRLTLAVLTGLIWPIVLVGLVQAGIIAWTLRHRTAKDREDEAAAARMWENLSSDVDPGLVPWSPSLGCRRLVDHATEPEWQGAERRRA